ncbi:MAG: hypothetical protein HKN57_06135 [Xanthomonadales bacterium]|nr:hypothetical protein [Xanthomonadales bacterium]
MAYGLNCGKSIFRIFELKTTTKKTDQQVNWETGAAIAEILAAVAVIASLIYLATQIRQNNELLRSESRQALVTNDVTSLSANFQNADVFAKYVAESDL